MGAILRQKKINVSLTNYKLAKVAMLQRFLVIFSALFRCKEMAALQHGSTLVVH